MVKPSPFCILDEIDAALDEANVGRFVNTLVEFGKKSQFIVITHNKKTVTGAGTLLGVTMEESGVSKAVAIRLDNSGQRADAVIDEEPKAEVE
jgi:chromosome segregation protein